MAGLYGAQGLHVTEITVKTDSVWRRLATVISGAEENNELYRLAEEQRAALRIVKSNRDLLVRVVLPFC